MEIHHIIPQSEGGADREENAAPLCPTCHETYGANPEKRSWIREARDEWYRKCELMLNVRTLDPAEIAQAVSASIQADLAEMRQLLMQRALTMTATSSAELSFGTFDSSDGAYFNMLVRYIEQAREVRVAAYMTGHAVNTPFRPTQSYLRSRKRYWNTLLDRAREGMAYHRIITTDRVAAGRDLELLRPDTREHCVAMLDVARLHPSTVSLRRAPAEVLADIAIIGEGIGAFSTEVYAPRSGTHTVGALIVRDPPDHQILDRLRIWWRELQDLSSPIRVGEFT